MKGGCAWQGGHALRRSMLHTLTVVVMQISRFHAPSIYLNRFNETKLFLNKKGLSVLIITGKFECVVFTERQPSLLKSDLEAVADPRGCLRIKIFLISCSFLGKSGKYVC